MDEVTGIINKDSSHSLGLMSWLKGVYMVSARCLQGAYMCQDDTCEIISQSGHPFNSYEQKSKCSIYVYH